MFAELSNMTVPPEVSIITPTFCRPRWLPALYSCVAGQSVTAVEWLVLDDSPTPSGFMERLSDPRVVYTHDTQRRTIGAKRNILCAKASAPTIVQFDDDDFYGPDYIAQMVKAIADSNVGLAKLFGAFIISLSHGVLGYWDFTKTQERHLVLSGQTPQWIRIDGKAAEEFKHMRHGFGFSLAFRREVWLAAPFADVNFDEDRRFVEQNMRTHGLTGFQDAACSCLHTVHPNSTSRCFPQYMLPPFMFDRLFPAARPWLSIAKT